MGIQLADDRGVDGNVVQPCHILLCDDLDCNAGTFGSGSDSLCHAIVTSGILRDIDRGLHVTN